MKRVLSLVIILVLAVSLFGCNNNIVDVDDTTYIGTFLGYKNYGELTKEEVTDPNFDGYMFLVNGKEVGLRICEDTTYSIQNQLKIGQKYEIEVVLDALISVREIETNIETYTAPTTGTPGEKTILNYLRIAMEPVGTTLYVYGGGWNWQDDSGDTNASSIGISKDWYSFFKSQDANYNYKYVVGTNNTEEDPKNSLYPYGQFNAYHASGLDCSGYVGWTVYNIINPEDSSVSYVFSSRKTSKILSNEYNYGQFVHNESGSTLVDTLKPGDIVSGSGHVWIFLGRCSDGSSVILHSTASLSRNGEMGGGCQLSAMNPDDFSGKSEAENLCAEYMEKYFPEWYERYSIKVVNTSVYMNFENREDAGVFHWSILEDPEGLSEMTAMEVLKAVFGE